MRSKDEAGNQNDWRSKEHNPGKTAEAATAETLLGLDPPWGGGISETTMQVKKQGETLEVPIAA